MKKTFKHLIALAATALLTFTACTDENEPAQPTADTQQLSFTITDGNGYASAEAGTRAEENGYATVFTAGDACGLYIVRGTQIVYDNIKLTATADDAGNLTWSAPAGTTMAGGVTGEEYYLYYPYQSDMTGKTATSITTGMGDADFFKTLISSWRPNTDQSTYSKYTASDLMTASGTASTTTSGTINVSFSATHRMALAVIELPGKTTYKFTNTTGGAIDDYTVQITPEVAFGGNIGMLSASGCTYRYIVNPSSSATANIVGTYAIGTKEFTISKSDLKAISSGNYRKFVVDGGNAATITQDYNIQIGDYLMRDGSLLPKGTTLTDEQKANVAAIVFWTPAETATTGRTYPAKLSDDKVMTAHFPDCTHGLAVAIKDMGKMIWQNTAEFVGNFQSSANFSPTNPDKTSYNPINSDDYDYRYFTISGYQNTQVLKAYNDYCKKTDSKADYVVLPVDSLSRFEANFPAPAGSTGWYIPSMKELHMLCYKDVDDTDSQYGAIYNDTRNIVDVSLYAAGGDQFLAKGDTGHGYAEDDYKIFASNEDELYNNYNYGITLCNHMDESETASFCFCNKVTVPTHVRAVCAF